MQVTRQTSKKKTSTARSAAVFVVVSKNTFLQSRQTGQDEQECYSRQSSISSASAGAGDCCAVDLPRAVKPVNRRPGRSAGEIDSDVPRAAARGQAFLFGCVVSRELRRGVRLKVGDAVRRDEVYWRGFMVCLFFGVLTF